MSHIYSHHTGDGLQSRAVALCGVESPPATLPPAGMVRQPDRVRVMPDCRGCLARWEFVRPGQRELPL